MSLDKVDMTPQQQAAVEKQGKVIVSASAGSGKTFVMIRRLINLIIGGESLDNVLAVTFTRKATAGMIEKLRSALIAAINSESDEKKKKHLKEQLGKVSTADISTIHAFCSTLVRSYFYLADVPNDFDIVSLDDSVGRGLFLEAMGNVIGAGYAAIDEDKDFALLLKTFVRSGRDTSELENIIKEVYYKLRVTADYRSATEYFSCFSRERFNAIRAELLSEYKEKCDRLLSLAVEILPENIPEALSDCALAKEYIAGVDMAFSLNTLEGASTALALLKKPRKSTKRVGLSDEELALRDEISAIKEAAASYANDFSAYKFSGDEEEFKKYSSSGELARAIYNYALKFDDEYSRLKMEKSKLDYGDLEHIALKILRSDEAKAALKEKYRYIFVDEYQDVNPLQEEILSLISGENVFLVGDGKQAIYGFRGGKSIYFNQKVAEFGDGSLPLDRNFRSASGILKFVNLIFRSAMTKDSAGIDYADMAYGGRYGDKEGYVKIYRCGDEDEKKDITEVYSIPELNAAAPKPSAQARQIYTIINDCVNAPSAKEDINSSRIYSPEKGDFRKIEYGDIAILSRNDDDSLKETVSFLVSRGVPVVSLSEVNVCNYPEVKQLIGVLQYIDNPLQDVPLCTAMLSPFGGFSEEELSQIKIWANDYSAESDAPRTFCGDCAAYAEKENGALAIKLRDFFNGATALALRAQTLSSGEVISLLLSEYNFETDILSREDGIGRMARVERFASEASEEKSLHEFLDELERLDYSVTYSENGGENAVKVLTVHKSKGLEFPVVILAGAGAAFHSVKRDSLIFDEKYGFAPQYYNYAEMRKCRTVFSRRAEKAAERERLKDELNLFYVALTRAEYALHIVYKGKKKGKSPYLPPNSYIDFIPPYVEEEYLSLSEADYTEEEESGVVLPSGGEEEEKLIRAEYKRGYDYKESCTLAVKSSATTLLKDEVDDGFYAEAYLVRAIDENYLADKNNCSVDMDVNADVGTAYHKFLERADFSRGGDEEYDRLKGEIPEEYYSLLSREQCKKILLIPQLKELSSARTVREKQFVVSFPANKFMNTSASDSVIYQGAIDLFAFTKKGCSLIDYKYSRRSDGDIASHYLLQMRLYRATLAKILDISEESISVTIINIRTCRAIPIDIKN